MRKESKNKPAKRGFFAWIMEHVSPSVTFDQTDSEAGYLDHSGGPPHAGFGSLGQWINYTKDKTTFWIKFRFRF